MTDTFLPDLPQDVVDWAQVAGAVLGLVAIIVSFYALWKQRRDQIADLQFQSDLETLRRIRELAGQSEESLGEIQVLSVMLYRDMKEAHPYLHQELGNIRARCEDLPDDSSISPLEHRKKVWDETRVLLWGLATMAVHRHIMRRSR